MRILGLDIATTSGWALIAGDEIRAGKFTAKGSSDGEVSSAFRLWVRGLVIAEEPDFIAIEAPKLMMPRVVDDNSGQADAFGRKPKKMASNPKTDAKLNWLNVIAQMCCHELSIPFELVGPSTHRKAFLGRGTFPAGTAKTEALKQCAKLGLDLKSKDSADAVSVAWWGAGRMKQIRMMPGDMFFNQSQG